MTHTAFDDLVTVGPLEVTRAGTSGQESLLVPLEAIVGAHRTQIQLFDGGVVWEDDPVRLSFRVEATERIRRATLTINDHNELWMSTEWLPPLSLDGGLTYRYEFVVDPDNDSPDYRTPFLLTCGIARVGVRVIMLDGREARFESYDIVSLDEPQETVDGQHGERSEESNVRSMYQTLTKVTDNQAAEWMFSPPEDQCGAALSADEATDWAHASLARLLGVASNTLDLVYDGLEDEGDAFPNSTTDRAAASPVDTPENRAVRALLASLAARCEAASQELDEAATTLGEMIRQLQDLVKVEGARRGRKQSLPVVSFFQDQLQQERVWLAQAQDLAERSAAALADFDTFVGGAGCVTEQPFELPAREGIFATDRCYRQLHAAIETWAQIRASDTRRRDVLLHAIKPDRLYEYYALHRMLSWLHEHGFAEDMRCERPIDHFAYRLAQTYDKYDNEWRSANTFHLCRTYANGDFDEVHLYYQPVIYADEEPENGLGLRRTDQAVYTPDFVLVVRDGRGVRRYAIDAKYRPWSYLIGRKGILASCLKRYYARIRAITEEGERPLDGVWILAGRLNEARLWTCRAVTDGLVDEHAVPRGANARCGVVSWNRETGSSRQSKFFAQLGIRER